MVASTSTLGGISFVRNAKNVGVYQREADILRGLHKKKGRGGQKSCYLYNFGTTLTEHKAQLGGEKKKLAKNGQAEQQIRA